jgi:phage replication-related protein YjqB (UPF0714/DUF867 family)
MDNYNDFEDLRNNEPVASFDIAFKDRKSHFLIFSPHAGGIEQGIGKNPPTQSQQTQRTSASKLAEIKGCHSPTINKISSA